MVTGKVVGGTALVKINSEWLSLLQYAHKKEGNKKGGKQS